MLQRFTDPLVLGQLAVAIFFSILFLQSGLDKVSDWKGNMEWLKGHFGKTFLKGSVPLMTATITAVELVTGLLAAVGAVVLIVNGCAAYIQYSLYLAALAFLMLFFGQRIAKDYAGAASLAIYFGVVMLGLWMVAA